MHENVKKSGCKVEGKKTLGTLGFASTEKENTYKMILEK